MQSGLMNKVTVTPANIAIKKNNMKEENKDLDHWLTLTYAHFMSMSSRNKNDVFAIVVFKGLLRLK